MKVSKKCQYSLRALVDLGIAQLLNRPLVRIEDIAEKENLPLKFLEQIFLQLRNSGVIESRRGKQGGYLLAMPASEINVGEVMCQIDGPLAPVPCVSRRAYQRCSCPDQAYCGVHALMADVHRAVTDILDNVTIGDIARQTLRKIRRNKASIPFLKLFGRRRSRKTATSASKGNKGMIYGKTPGKKSSARWKKRTKSVSTRRQAR